MHKSSLPSCRQNWQFTKRFCNSPFPPFVDNISVSTSSPSSYLLGVSLRFSRHHPLLHTRIAAHTLPPSRSASLLGRKRYALHPTFLSSSHFYIFPLFVNTPIVFTNNPFLASMGRLPKIGALQSCPSLQSMPITSVT